MLKLLTLNGGATWIGNPRFAGALAGTAAATFAAALFYEPLLSLYAFYALCLFGVLSFWRAEGIRKLPGEGRILIGTFLFALAGYFASFLANGADFEQWRHIESNHLKLLGLIPIIWFSFRYRMSEGLVWWVFAVGAGAAGVVALRGLFDVDAMTAVSSGTWRAAGTDHPVVYGTVSLAYTAGTLAGFRYFRQCGYRLAAYVAALGLGCTAIVLSGTRGAWLAMPILLLAVIAIVWPHVSRRWRLLGFMSLIMLPILAYQIPKVEIRVTQAVNNVSNYFDPDLYEVARTTSSGLRLEMWQAAWKIFARNPWFGVGPGDYRPEVQKLVHSGEVWGGIARYPHPHNQYLAAMSMVGVIGLLATVLLLVVPLVIFFRRTREPGQVGRLALAGTTICVGYMVFGLTDVPLEWKKPIAFYVLAVGLIYGAIASYEASEK